MTPAIMQWAIRHGVSLQALEELKTMFGLAGAGSIPDGRNSAMDESGVQSLIRLEGSRKGVPMWRNNVGALLDARGVPVRYGLANDSKQLNARLKSGDLIGIRPVLITPGHVGMVIGQFVSRECKRPGWRYTDTEHERAQLAWAQLIVSHGGDAAFANGDGTL